MRHAVAVLLCLLELRPADRARRDWAHVDEERASIFLHDAHVAVVVDELRKLRVRLRRPRHVRHARHHRLHVRIVEAGGRVAPAVRRGADLGLDVAEGAVLLKA